METLTIRIVNDSSAVMQVLRGLSKMGAIAIESEESPYDPAMVEKIKRGQRDIAAGRGKKIDVKDLWI